MVIKINTTSDMCDIKPELCMDCDAEWIEADKEIDALITAGHSTRCAVRQVWGGAGCGCIAGKVKAEAVGT